MAADDNNKEMKEVDRWKCDYCPSTFDTFEEASTHEECCKLSQTFAEPKPTIRRPQIAKSKQLKGPIHPFFAKPAKTKAKDDQNQTTEPIGTQSEATDSKKRPMVSPIPPPRKKQPKKRRSKWEPVPFFQGTISIEPEEERECQFAWRDYFDKPADLSDDNNCCTVSLLDASDNIQRPPPCAPSSLLVGYSVSWNHGEELCGSSLQQAAKEIEDWLRPMLNEQNEAEDDVEYDDGDALWSDEENDEGCSPMSFTLAGKIGSGKTSLVYKLAKKFNCQVLEVNTTTTETSWLTRTRRRTMQGELTVVLVDEADLLDIAIKTKCPVIRTARGSSIDRPSIDECLEFLSDWNVPQQKLREFCQACHCDLRRMHWELQVAMADCNGQTSAGQEAKCEERRFGFIEPPSHSHPVVTRIIPAVLPSHGPPRLVTISGSGFPSQVSVTIGGLPATAFQVLDSETIAAVVAAPARPGIAVVDVNSIPKLGCLSKGAAHSCLLRFASTGNDDDDDCCFGENEERNNSAPTLLPLELSLPIKDAKLTRKLLDDGIQAHRSTKSQSAQEAAPLSPKLSDATEMEAIAEKAESSSSGALFCAYDGVPVLTGACRGFGFDFTGTPKDNETSKPPREARLFRSGWKDSFYGGADSHLIWPLSDRNLLSRAESCYRYSGLEMSEDPTDEEDFLMKPMIIASLRNLAYAMDFHDQNNPLPTAREEYYLSVKKLLRETIFAGCNGLTSFLAGIVRDLDTTADPRGWFDSRLVLDYLPILRLICQLETIATEDSSEDADSLLGNRRSTRIARRRGQRMHHLERIIPDFVVREGLVDCSELGGKLAAGRLVFWKQGPCTTSLV